MTLSDERRAEALAYLADDPDADARATLQRWLDADDALAIEAAFTAPISFGTAGLRAEVGPGPAGMNLRNVLRATRALLEELEAASPEAARIGLVVGYDARPTSRPFAEAARDLAAAQGFRVHVFEEPTPTPVVAYAAAALGAPAIVLTASHNPPADNGMKVYGPGGSQIVPPWDRAIAARMHDARSTPARPDAARFDDATRARIVPVPREIPEAYRRRCLALGARDVPRAPVRVAYTALHGVGSAWVRGLLAELGAVELHEVTEQALPDGLFPTTRNPNPEDPAALARVLALAEQVQADLVLANDPDADRLALAVRHEGALVGLHGDELGVLLGDALLARSDAPRPFVLTTIVSSPWLLAIAPARGARAERTLTGHKWIHHRAAELTAEGGRFVFGYEEALGYAFDVGVRDKDGIAAATFVARLASELRAEDRTLVDALESIARASALHRSRLVSTAFHGPDAAERMQRTITALRQAMPSRLGARRVLRVLDGATSTIREADGREAPLGLPRSSLVGLELDDGARVLLRPSGTEPKLKLYLDLPTELAPDERYLAARARADRALDELARDALGLLASA